MKKVLFTIQMIALVAIFPVYLVAELNHRTGSLPVNNPPSELTERPGEDNVQPSLKYAYEGLSFSMIKMNVYYLNQ